MPNSILARCGLWVADYHDSPELPVAWEKTGWRLWQYAGDESASRPAYNQTTIVRGVSHCEPQPIQRECGRACSGSGGAAN